VSDPAVAVGDFPCDLCGSEDAVELPHARELTGGKPIHVCTGCGFVYVRRRRSAEEIAATWSDEIFGAAYTAKIPAVTARLTYVAELVDAELGLAGKRLCEIGAGEGEFLELARARGADVFGIEPSSKNCALLDEKGFRSYNGTIERYGDSGGAEPAFDLVAMLWTLETCQDCRRMLAGAHSLLDEGGHVVVATGSRILVPFKKPLWAYIGRSPADTHAFRFSAATLGGMLAVSGFEPMFVNRFLDHDVLCVIGAKAAAGAEIAWQGDDYEAVRSFFERWYADTAAHFPPPQ
jgi:2-polyprenyl-3-methyl-5-hydroxy-6-metoxy-1,4-benzoquinol methylase